MLRLLSVLLIILSTTNVQARCTRCSYHTLSYTRNWSAGCWAAGCHTSSSNNRYAPTPEGLKLQLLDIAKDREAWLRQAESRKQTHIEIMEMIQSLGIQSPQYNTTYAETGSTVYGYGGGYSNSRYSQYSENWGTIDLITMYQAAAKLAESAQAAGTQATSEYSALIKQQVEGQLAAMEVEARGRAAAAALSAAKGHPPADWSKTTTFSVTVGPDGKPTVSQTNTQISSNLQALTGCIQLRCLKCHSGNEPKGGVDLTQFATFNREQWDRVLGALDQADSKKRMPKDAPPLTFQERTLFMAYQPKE